MFEYSHNGVVLRAKGVSLSFGDNLVLRNVNMEVLDIVRPEVTQGQVVGLLGPSGIGKTQFLRIVAGLQSPDSGVVTLGAQDLPVRRGLVGVVAQNYPLFRHRTVLGNLLVAGKQANLPEKEAKEKAEHLLHEFNLHDRASYYPDQLSGGQKQRVAIAQQLMCSEYFVLMDEPFSGLDPLMVEKVTGLIQKVSSMHEHITIIVITHSIPDAVTVSDTLYLMGRDRDAEGKIVPGAYMKHKYDLAQMGLAWRPDVSKDPRFHRLVGELKDQFHTL